ncbi:hypothetical protein Fcan01_11328 [Folsomia candida]|uniref:Uncharacterized protein n=1 Tax=Folsomia candida TaxID=158441 RepID=A0A226E7W3_FOLCA|nr:hypothetical protein Fcan01_11328 [Folsomia candida]
MAGIHQSKSFILSLLLLTMEDSVTIKNNVTSAASFTINKRIQEIKVSEYLKHFKNCTTVVIIPENVSIGIVMSQYAPIVLYDYVLNQGYDIEDTFSLTARRNPSPHCWALFSILPVTRADFDLDQENLDPGFGPEFINEYWQNQYFIWVTTVHRKIQQRMKRLQHDARYRTGVREFMIINLKNDLIPSNKIRLLYYNPYHMDALFVSKEPSQQWYIVDCLPNDCFTQIQSVSRNVSQKNKHFWETRQLNLLLRTIDSKKLPTGYRSIANFLTFNAFIRYWILQDVIHHTGPNITWPYKFPPIQRSPYPRRTTRHIAFVAYTLRKNPRDKCTFYTIRMHLPRGFFLRVYGKQKFSYVSCYDVHPVNSGHISALAIPFDGITWTFILLSFTPFIFIVIFHSSISNAAAFVIGILLENSGPELLSRYVNSVRILITIWIIMGGIILPNCYKTFFTMEMILPITYTSSWESVLQVDGVNILTPINPLDERERDQTKMPELLQHAHFFRELLPALVTLTESSIGHKRFEGYMKITQNVLNCVRKFFGIGEDMRFYGNGTYYRHLRTGGGSYSRDELKDCRIQPISYQQTNLLLKTLSTCSKVALMDTKENIAAITVFLNDNVNKVKYIKGDDDTLFGAYRGW